MRTPLNAIIGFSEVLLDDGTGAYAGPTRSNFLDHIHGSGKKLLGMINDILDLAKVESRQDGGAGRELLDARSWSRGLDPPGRWPSEEHRDLEPADEAGTIVADPES